MRSFRHVALAVLFCVAAPVGAQRLPHDLAVLAHASAALAHASAVLAPGAFLPSKSPMELLSSTNVEEGQGRRSVVGAALMSLAVPGAGQYYLQDEGSALVFLGAEAVLWSGYAAVDGYGRWTQSAARAHAVEHAGVLSAGKDDQFFVDVGNYLSVYDYNAKKLRDRQLSKVYDAAAGYGWQWDSDASRAKYRTMRINADAAFSATKFVLAGVIVNHVISALHAGRQASRWNASISRTGLRGNGTPGIVLNVVVRLD